ncbi:MAG: type II toxin-antitoxin system RelE/ParE family toxin [Burkholderiaceae bacterium]|nr:type II toxin-antitoxin system RelE/ParE family toxin [Burkholderiaceae bacterium]
MAQVVLSEPALDDLGRLRQFLLDTVPERAEIITTSVLDALNLLAAHPRIGRRSSGELRELVIGQGKTGYLALYVYDEMRDVVRILRLRHQREAGYRD